MTRSVAGELHRSYSTKPNESLLRDDYAHKYLEFSRLPLEEAMMSLSRDGLPNDFEHVSVKSLGSEEATKTQDMWKKRRLSGMSSLMKMDPDHREILQLVHRHANQGAGLINLCAWNANEPFAILWQSAQGEGESDRTG